MSDELHDPVLAALVVAHAALIGHAGVSSLEFGYLDENAPIAEARWWARARLKVGHPEGRPETVDATGHVVMVEEETGPVEVLTALAKKLIAGGICQACGRLVVVSRPVTIVGRQSLCFWRIEVEGTEVEWVRSCGHPMSPTPPGSITVD